LAFQLPLPECSKTTEKLLALGASSTQADKNSFSALEYFVNNGNTEVLDILLKFDEPVAKRAINHLSIRGSQHHAHAGTPLLPVLEGRHFGVVKTLLEIGAEHTN
jgi:ankyrin repeat protein